MVPEKRNYFAPWERAYQRIATPFEEFIHRQTTTGILLITCAIIALANAAIPLYMDSISSAMTDPIALGIVLGLVGGKLAGIAGSVLLVQRLGIGTLPEDLTSRHIIGAAFVAGIGFTMSIFISELAFQWDGEVVVVAKMGIFFASLIAGICGYLWLRFFYPSGAGKQRWVCATLTNQPLSCCCLCLEWLQFDNQEWQQGEVAQQGNNH
jgi:NhaA family Na+:H+ antiporter